MLTVEEAALHLVETDRKDAPPHHSTVKRWIHRKRNPLPAKRKGNGHAGQGGAWLIDAEDLDKFILPRAGRPHGSRGVRKSNV